MRRYIFHIDLDERKVRQRPQYVVRLEFASTHELKTHEFESF